MTLAEMGQLEELARRAAGGDRDAVADVVRALERDVYGLALRILWQPQDAEDATQEILVRVVTRLGQFDFESRLKTWVFRVATNYLLDVKKSCVERQRLDFVSFAEDLGEGLAGLDTIDRRPSPERSFLTEEVKIGCTLGLLQCLDRPHRLAYVLGEIFEWSAPEAAAALEIEPGAFRKRLQRAREAIEAFTRAHCGLVSETAICACDRRVPVAIRLGRVDPERLRFARSASSFAEARAFIVKVETLKQVTAVQQSAIPPGPSRDFARIIASAIEPPRN